MSTDTSDDPVSAVEVTHSPATTSSAIATAAGLLAVLSSGLTSSILALALGLFGLAGLAAGLFAVRSQWLATAGTGVVFLGVVVGGLTGAPEPFLVFAALATIVAFDLGGNAFSVGAQLSDLTDTRRGELVHAAATVGVGTIAAVFGYAVYLLAASGQPVGALLFVLLGGVVLTWAIRA